MKTLFLFSSMALLTTGCTTKPDVIVTDASGAPIAGAKVEPVSLSMNQAAVTTDAKGEASIPKSVQPVQWISVKSTGFVDQKSIDFTGPKPIKVVLTR